MTKLPAWTSLLQSAIIFALVGWIYWPSVHGDWLWDDNIYITGNRTFSEPWALLKIWFVPGTYFEYFPITETVQWVQWQLWGDDTFGYHLTNLTLHALDASLFWRLLAKFGLRFAWMGAVLFAIHPMNVESVAWISELKNTLSLAPTLLCLAAFMDYENTKEVRFYWQALAAFGIALLCKNSMVCLPFCLLLYLCWKNGRVGQGDLKTIAPFFVLSVLTTALTLGAAWQYEKNHGITAAAGLVSHVEVSSFFVLSASGISFYFEHYVYPFNLVAFYPPWNENPVSRAFLVQVIAFCIGGWATFRKNLPASRTIVLGLSFFFLNLLPLIVLIYARYPYFVWSLDHSAYLPLLGLMGLTVAAIEHLHRFLPDRSRPLLLVALLCLALPLALFSQGYASRFVDAKALWIYTLQHRSSSAHAF